MIIIVSHSRRLTHHPLACLAAHFGFIFLNPLQLVAATKVDQNKSLPFIQFVSFLIIFLANDNVLYEVSFRSIETKKFYFWTKNYKKKLLWPETRFLCVSLLHWLRLENKEKTQNRSRRDFSFVCCFCQIIYFAVGWVSVRHQQSLIKLIKKIRIS